MNGSAASILVDVLMDGVHNPLGSEEFRTSGFCFSVLGYIVSTCAVVYISRKSCFCFVECDVRFWWLAQVGCRCHSSAAFSFAREFNLLRFRFGFPPQRLVDLARPKFSRLPGLVSTVPHAAGVVLPCCVCCFHVRRNYGCLLVFYFAVAHKVRVGLAGLPTRPGCGALQYSGGLLLRP